MTIYVFLIDNSASMAQASYAGASMLDLAKNFVEIFQKVRLFYISQTSFIHSIFSLSGSTKGIF